MKEDSNRTGKIIGLDEPDTSPVELNVHLAEKPGVNKTRRMMNWILFFLLLAILVFVVQWRLRSGFVQVKIVDKVDPESSAEQDSAFAQRLRQRFNRQPRSTYKRSEVLAAVNGITEDGKKIFNLWQRAHKLTPAGQINPVNAKTQLDRLQPAFALLDSTELFFQSASQKCEVIHNASRQPGDKAYQLSRLYTCAEKLIAFIREENKLRRDYFDAIRAALSAVEAKDRNEYDVKLNVVKYYNRKFEDRQDLHESKIREFNEAADALFNR